MTLSIKARAPLVFLLVSIVVSSQISIIHGLRVESHVICSELDSYHKPLRFKTDFKKGDPWVISWVKLRNVDKAYTCTWKWRDPDKNLWTETSEEVAPGAESVYSYLPLEDAMFEKPGFWAVLFYTDDQYQFTDHFTILSEEKTTRTATTAVTTVETSVETPTNRYVLDIVDIFVSPAEGEHIYPGDTVKITYVIENSGDAPARNIIITVEAVPSGLEFAGANPPKDIPVAGRAEFTLEFQALTPGVYELTRQIIGDGEILDTGTITISVSQPDVYITSVDVKTIPSEGVALKPGDYLTYIISLKNTGTTPARTVEFKPTKIPEGVKLVESTPPTEIQAGETKDFNLKFLCEKAGYYEIPLTTVVMGKTFDSGTLEISVTKPATVSWPMIGGLLAAIIIAGAVIFYKKRGFRRAGLPEAAKKPPEAKRKPMETVGGYCIHCGAPVAESDKFCGKCGNPPR
ncbi:MAG: hypothetical protein QXO32_06225 [Candidatus Bathyarchaeia archaeon]